MSEKKKPDLKMMLSGDAFRQQVALALPKHLTPERFIRVAVTALTRTPKLMECDPASFFKCLLDLSAYGLEPDGRRAHLIPFNNNKLGIVECQLLLDWKGVVELAKRSGDVKSWRAETVCEHDTFSWRNGEIEHIIDWRRPRGEVQAVYSSVTLSDGFVDTEVLTLEEVANARSRSRAKNDGPWVTDWAEMAKKTAIRRHSKRLTLSPEFHEAVLADLERDAMPANARVVEEARIPSFLPAPAPQSALPPAREAEPPVAAQREPEPVEAQQQTTEPPRQRRAPRQRPVEEAPPLTLEATTETARDLLERKIKEDNLDPDRVEAWLRDQLIPPVDQMMANEADAVLDQYTDLKTYAASA